VTRVVRVTRAAIATVINRLPQTITARSGPLKISWKMPTNRMTHRSGQSYSQANRAGMRASPKPPATVGTATASCHGRVAATTAMIAISMPSHFCPAGIHCSTKDPA